MTEQEKGNVIKMSEDYGYKGKMERDEELEDTEAVDSLPVAKIEEWLDPDAEMPTKWIRLSSKNARVRVKALSQKEFKQLRNKAPVSKNKKGKLVKDEDWIQNHMVISCVVEPKIPSVSLLENALAGDLTHIIMEITKLSGFDVDSVLRDALE